MYCLFEKTENKQKKKPGFAHFLKKNNMRVKYSSKELSKAVKNGNKNVIVNLLLDKNMDQPRTKHFDQFGLFKRGTISSNNLTVKKLF